MRAFCVCVAQIHLQRASECVLREHSSVRVSSGDVKFLVRSPPVFLLDSTLQRSPLAVDATDVMDATDFVDVTDMVDVTDTIACGCYRHHGLWVLHYGLLQTQLTVDVADIVDVAHLRTLLVVDATDIVNVTITRHH